LKAPPRSDFLARTVVTQANALALSNSSKIQSGQSFSVSHASQPKGSAERGINDFATYSRALARGGKSPVRSAHSKDQIERIETALAVLGKRWVVDGREAA
jgi:hypothetical protein